MLRAGAEVSTAFPAATRPPAQAPKPRLVRLDRRAFPKEPNSFGRYSKLNPLTLLAMLSQQHFGDKHNVYADFPNNAIYLLTGGIG